MTPPALEGYEVHAEESIYSQSVMLFLHGSQGGRRQIIGPMVGNVTQIEAGRPIPLEQRSPTLNFSISQARALMSAMWKIGIRPHGVTDDSERVLLLKEHVKSLESQISALSDLSNKHIELLKGAQEIILDIAPPRLASYAITNSGSGTGLEDLARRR